MKNIMREAHKLTKEMKNKYPEVDYKTQLGLFISYLLEKENNKEVKEMVKEFDERGKRIGMNIEKALNEYGHNFSGVHKMAKYMAKYMTEEQKEETKRLAKEYVEKEFTNDKGFDEFDRECFLETVLDYLK